MTSNNKKISDLQLKIEKKLCLFLYSQSIKIIDMTVIENKYEIYISFKIKNATHDVRPTIINDIGAPSDNFIKIFSLNRKEQAGRQIKLINPINNIHNNTSNNIIT